MRKRGYIWGLLVKIWGWFRPKLKEVQPYDSMWPVHQNCRCVLVPFDIEAGSLTPVDLDSLCAGDDEYAAISARLEKAIRDKKARQHIRDELDARREVLRAEWGL